MSMTYAPSGTESSVSRGWSGWAYADPGSQAYASQNPDRIDAKYFLNPVQSNVIGLWQAGGGLAGFQYSDKLWTCPAGLVVGDPVYVSSSGNVALALATTGPTSKVFGFVAEKPTSTSCYVCHFCQKTGLAALLSGSDVYLTDAGGYSLTPGTVAKIVGKAESTTVAWLCAMPVEAVSGWSGFSGVSGQSAWSGFSSTVAGPTGDSGVSGVSGFSGTYSGASGESGVSGFSGTYSGASGLSGFSGAPSVALARQVTIKTADTTRGPSGSISNDTHLTASLQTGKTYHIRMTIPMSTTFTGSGTLNANIRYNFTGTSSASNFYTRMHPSVSNTSGTYRYQYNWTINATNNTPVPVNTTANVYLEPYGYLSTSYLTMVVEGFITTTSSGTFTPQWTYTQPTYTWTWKTGSMLEVIEAGNGLLSESGASGTSGVSGFSGATLLSGYSGESGVSAESGVSGFSGFSGESGASAWSGVSGFVGATGGPGTSGTSGQSGGSGYSGVEGVSGFSGLSTSGYSGGSGFSGNSGISGWTGVSGFSGEVGDSGWSGSVGSQGTSGTSGRSGYSGLSGASAVSGISGFSGQGDSGYSGPSGQSGTSGISGISGWTGASGFSGTSGATGSQGLSGFSGLTLDSGYSGESGFSGAGTSGYSGQAGTWTGTDTITYVLDGGEYPISNGIKGSLMFDYAFTITDWVVIADQDGSVELDVWKTNYAGFPANATNSICGTNVPAIIDAQKGRALNMSGWTTSVAAGSILTFYVTECSSITRCTLCLKITRT